MNNNKIFCCSLSDQAKTTLTFRFETTNTHASAGHERLLPVPIHEIFDSIYSHIKVTYKSNNFIISHEKSVLPHFLYPQFIVFFREQPLEAVIQFWHFVKDVILLEKKEYLLERVQSVEDLSQRKQKILACKGDSSPQSLSFSIIHSFDRDQLLLYKSQCVPSYWIIEDGGSKAWHRS